MFKRENTVQIESKIGRNTITSPGLFNRSNTSQINEKKHVEQKALRFSEAANIRPSDLSPEQSQRVVYSPMKKLSQIKRMMQSTNLNGATQNKAIFSQDSLKGMDENEQDSSYIII